MDITYCYGKTDTGADCPKKDTCERWDVSPVPYPIWRAYYVASPYFNNNCEMYLEKK